jgi:hypothetical protein
MIHVKILIPEDDPRVTQINHELEGMFGGNIVQYVKQLMIEDHGSNVIKSQTHCHDLYTLPTNE